MRTNRNHISTLGAKAGRTSAAAGLAFLLALVILPPAPAAASTSGPKLAAWLPYWDQARALKSFTDNADLYSELSPFWYEMRGTTSVLAYPGAGDRTVVDAARSRGVRVIPTINNDFDPARVSTMLASSTNRTAHVNTLVNLVVNNGYDGIDIDYESMYAADRDRFTSFMTELGSALRSRGKVLAVALHPKTSEPGTWDGPRSQDYAALGRVVDRARVMAYDYHWSTSTAGPVAPLAWVDDVARFTASAIAPSKVQLGMPLYGYDWLGSSGEGLVHQDVEARRVKYGATRRWDDTAKAPWYSYSVNGSTRTVYYEDRESIKAKIPVVSRYGLAGAATWRLGGEDANVWSEFRTAWGSGGTTTTTTPPTDGTAPSKPASVKAATITGGVRVTWTASTDTGGSGLAGYEVHRSTSHSSGYAKIATVASPSTAYSDTGHKKGVRFYYKVLAYDGAGNKSVLSSYATARTG
ncbi:MAG TPA: glycosyl hydrolase family 18 protein [Actinomycetota bacterium]|nr:glycosyl hydrolase family 18 protein [Actinomycetota bacterium]